MTPDDIPWGDPPAERIEVATPRKCSHPKQYRQTTYVEAGLQTSETICTRCGHVFDPAKVTQGHKNLRRGKDAERAVAKALDGTRVGQYGGAEDVAAVFAIQVKAGPSYWPRSLARLLEDQRLAAAALGRAGPAVAYAETGNRGRRNRVIVAVFADDLARALKAGQGG